MNWTQGSRLLTNFLKRSGEITKSSASQYSSLDKHQKGILDTEKIVACSSQQQRQCVAPTSFQQLNLGSKNIDPQGTLILARNVLGKFEISCCIEGGVLRKKGHTVTVSRHFGQSIQDETKLNRDFLVQLWVADRKRKRSRAKKRHKLVNYANRGETVYGDQSSFQHPLGRWFSGSSVMEEKSHDQMKQVLKQPPLSQPTTGALEPASLEEARVAPLLARSNLLITRDIEWANLVFGFEQENRYAMVDVCYPQSPVGFIREQSNLIARQLLRLRRPFMAYITDALGNELFKVRRPFWWINSSIYAEIDGKEVGVVHRRWHLWKRVYDLYLGNNQFAVVENPGFWNWTFTLKDIDGQVLAQIDRDWRGFGFEIFTDAGQYVIRFGSADTSANIGNVGVVEELEVSRPLTLSERAVAVALAVSLDNDYFSRHGSWGIPFVAVGE
ncbi:Altered inheritance rate of mitochondria protein [Actinidia chinensis var. chinensis]|uniref:Altered inheritance rate of mitochondria protein n=1 Tax=Actinidia chinensis var. chinensis TaxID=1590841 RepID=A0A2R6Q9G2_ACTCC|nr:Altered inheritance rate of mitochondria protein [Actinidia chinensis var. chinensis]